MAVEDCRFLSTLMIQAGKIERVSLEKVIKIIYAHSLIRAHSERSGAMNAVVESLIGKLLAVSGRLEGSARCPVTSSRVPRRAPGAGGDGRGGVCAVSEAKWCRI